MLNKQDILNAIQQTAKENGGKPLGRSKFEKETGIKVYEIERFWARFSDAVREAGFTPNELNTSYSDEFLIEKAIGLMRKIRKFPTVAEFKIERNHDSTFPSKGAFQRIGQFQLATKINDYCKNHVGYEDVIGFCGSILQKSHNNKDSDSSTGKERIGEVYLFRSGKYYKIGKTNDSVRRGQELRIQLPENLDLIHSIKTDDPSGIESYWHRRFDSKRMNGEWFDLNSDDIKAFKRWRKII